MGMSRAALPPISRGARRSLALAAALLATAAIGAAPAFADAGKVLVFTGTAGTANPVSADAATAIKALGTANNFTVDTTAAARHQRGEARRLPRRRVRALLRRRARRRRETALQYYVQNGGGFVGIGETALLEQGNAFFDTLIGLTGAARTTGTAAVERAGRRVPRPRAPGDERAAAAQKAHTDAWYTWATNPTGRSTRSPACASTAPGRHVGHQRRRHALHRHDRDDPAAARAPRLLVPRRPAGPLVLHRLGGTSAASPTATSSKHLLGAIQWASGMTRGSCKATITSNYTRRA